jgi:hypothetical protein
MKAEELRINNLIYTPGGLIGIVTGITKVEIQCEWNAGEEELEVSSFELSDCNPIPLTEEWLIKLGFSKKLYKFGHIGITGMTLFKPENSNRLFYEICNIEMNIKIYSIHQLQNLYFDLTGNELKIK